MGIATAALLGLTAVGGLSGISDAKKNAKAIAAQGEQDALTSAQATQQKVSRAKVSFLNSGFTLEGTPMAALGGILNAGFQDVNNIAVNANSKAKNLVSAARTKAILGLGQAGLTAGIGAGLGAGLGDSLTFGTESWNGFGQAVGSGFNSTAEGPFLPFGMSQ